MKASERFEYMASLFYKETGLIAPGKDDAFSCQHDRRERADAWREWSDGFYSDVFKFYRDSLEDMGNNL